MSEQDVTTDTSEVATDQTASADDQLDPASAEPGIDPAQASAEPVIEPTPAQASAEPVIQQGAGGRNYRKVRVGLVTSDRMDKTVVVKVENRVKHPRYGKIMRQTSKLKAHDEQNSAGMGDRVLLMETKPSSATKRWRLVEILEKAK